MTGCVRLRVRLRARLIEKDVLAPNAYARGRMVDLGHGN